VSIVAASVVDSSVLVGAPARESCVCGWAAFVCLYSFCRFVWLLCVCMASVGVGRFAASVCLYSFCVCGPLRYFCVFVWLLCVWAALLLLWVVGCVYACGLRMRGSVHVGLQWACGLLLCVLGYSGLVGCFCACWLLLGYQKIESDLNSTLAF
jgi:hypothetical protein